MTLSTVQASSAEARQQDYLEQLLEYQKTLKQLLEQQPTAGKALTDLLHATIQRSFSDHPLPIALDAVTVEESIRITTHSGSQRVEVPHTPQCLLSDLFKQKPWGGESFEAPNRLYRYYTKATYAVKDPSGLNAMRTIKRTTGSTPEFETFVQGLLHSPDRYYQAQLDRFWGGAFTPGSPMTRSQWLAEQLGKALLAEASLRVEDRTLDAPCKALIGQLVASPSRDSRAHLPAEQRPAAFALSLKGQNNEPDIPLTRILVFSCKTPPGEMDASADIGAVALYTPNRGIESFASLRALDQALRIRLANIDSGKYLRLNIAWQDQARAQRYQEAAPLIGYTLIHANLFENSVRSLLDLQKQDIEHIWRLLPRHSVDIEQLDERFNRLAHIGSFLDIQDLVVERIRRFVSATLPKWYQDASTQDQQALNRLLNAEQESSNILVTRLKQAAIPSLRAFAQQELARRLDIDYPQRAINPDQVTVEMVTSLNPASLGGGVGPDHVAVSDDQTSRISYTSTLSLTELALRNSNPWDFTFFKLYTAEETSMSASIMDKAGNTTVLDESYLRSLIGDLDVSTGYDVLLQKRLIDDRAALRQAWIDSHRASMATHALAARLDNSSFIEDRENRGCQWIQTLIDGNSPAGRKTVDGHKIVASALVIAGSGGARNGYELNDVLMISVKKRQSVPNVVLYTPGAPTAQVFKEFTNMNSMQDFLKQQWASSPAWQRYFMQRLSTPGQASLTERKLSRTVLLSELVLGARSRIGNPFDTLHVFAITVPLHDALYEQQVHTLRRNADHESTSNAEVEQQSLWNKIMFGVELAIDLIGFIPLTATLRATSSVIRTLLLLEQLGSSTSAARAIWSITGARGRILLRPRPAAIPSLLRGPDLSGLEVTVNPLELNRLKGNLFQSKVSAQQYLLLNDKHYLCDVAQQQRFVYGRGAETLRHPLVLDATLENWTPQPRPRLPGGMDPIEKGPLETTHLDYELPVADLTSLPLPNLSRPGSLSLDILHPSLPLDISAGVLHLFAIQSRLRRHARSYFRTFTAPARPLALPARDLLPEQLFNHLFNRHNGLVIGESHIFALARRLLIENMAALKTQGLRNLYLEVFTTDLHQVHLDRFNASETLPLPAPLGDRLQLADTLNAQTGLYSYTRLVDVAHAQGVHVMALDITASSLCTPQDLLPPAATPTLSDHLDRITLFNFFAYKRIAFDQLAQGSHRWVALVGTAHCNTLQGIPGLAELTGASSIRLGGRIPTLPSRIKSDPGVLIGSPSGTYQLRIHCDLLISLGNQANGPSLAMRVYRPNLFAIINPPPGQAFVHYMNAQGNHVDVPVLADGTQAYVNHFEFGSVSNRRFIDLAALADALTDELQMIEV
ncbi:membrane-targeted effector domain-containing toxin [Pseudomonas fluorescens]|uniref:Dermonecrotic toxin N-terminal domain-containing protein n=1 Tax=Pseudomonas fluorescens TaxID=294 RepID=A0A5E7CQS1_PSEFL|nr:membrane-targeted effector domain-containing toxin [Pseudomonas fluorescens]VVO04338.1 hypothetical protein PS691_02879 [Pseudomonas fluorescens]